MDTPKVFESEYRFCLILWEHQPVKSKELVRLCQEQLGWKSTTTYTVIKRLSERGVVKNENTVVTSLVSKDQAQQAVDFIDVVAWRNQAEFVTKYFKKGSSLCIVGSVQTRSWQDQQGNKRYATEIVADEAMFVDSKSEDTPSAQNAPQSQNFGAYSTLAPKFEDIKQDDDLPF